MNDLATFAAHLGALTPAVTGWGIALDKLRGLAGDGAVLAYCGVAAVLLRQTGHRLFGRGR